MKVLGAIDTSNCHVDGLRNPTGGPKALSSNETIATMERALSWVMVQWRCDGWPWNLDRRVGVDTETQKRLETV